MAEQLSDLITYGTVDRAYEEQLRKVAAEDDGPVFMVNLMRYKPTAEYPDGRETDLTGAQADALYAPFDVFAEIGAELALYATVLEEVDGDGAAFDAVAVVRYASRRSFVEMQERPDYLDRHVHKEAGMDWTIIVVSTPRSDGALEAEPGGTLLLHLSPEGHEAGALPEGAGLVAALSTEGTAVGDDRRWGDLWFARTEAASVAGAPAGSYSLRLSPLIDRLARSVSEVAG